MKMVAIIAWRNIWRNHTRSFVVIGSIIIGIIALVFMSGFMNSFLTGYIDKAIKYEFSNIQIHHPNFKTDYEIQYQISNGYELIEKLRSYPEVKAVGVRSLSNGMISSAKKATGVQIMGIEPKSEAELTEIDSLITEGSFFDTKRKNAIVIGQKLAKELGVRIRSKVVLTFQDINGNITAGAFRVVGILKSTSLKINQGTAYVIRNDLNKLLEIENNFHEIAIVTQNESDEIGLKAKLMSEHPDLLIEDWKELAPILEFMLQWFALSLRIFIVIVMIALIFGIINTMLMSVLERFKELGVLMAVGMNKLKVFAMVMIETVFLALLGGPVGLFLGYLMVMYLGNQGINLQSYSEGLTALGYDSILYPELEPSIYVEISLGVILTALIGAIYPAWKAIKLKPSEAIAKI